MKDTDKIPAIANRFGYVIREWLTPDEILQVLIMNAQETGGNAINACNTHEFCDPNEAMIQAFKAIMDREIDTASQDEMGLICNAWNVAKANHFKRVETVETYKFHECTVTGAPIARGSKVVEISYYDGRETVVQYISDPSYLSHCIKFY